MNLLLASLKRQPPEPEQPLGSPMAADSWGKTGCETKKMVDDSWGFTAQSPSWKETCNKFMPLLENHYRLRDSDSLPSPCNERTLVRTAEGRWLQCCSIKSPPSFDLPPKDLVCQRMFEWPREACSYCTGPDQVCMA